MKKKIKILFKLFSRKYQKIILDYKVAPKPRDFDRLNNKYSINAVIKKNTESYRSTLEQILSFKDVFLNFKYSSDKDVRKNEPTWNNGYLPGLDIVSIYSLTRTIKPKKIIEIGSGNSTRVFRKAISDGELSTELISIDPCPRVDILELSDAIHRSKLEDLEDVSFIIDRLDENDFLFVDNSHIVFPNSDAMVVFMEILPLLKKGVYVHFHDIYLPYDYPQFMCDRFYNEQYFLNAFLINNPDRYEVILPNFYISQNQELSNLMKPLWSEKYLQNVEQHGGSFWIKVH